MPIQPLESQRLYQQAADQIRTLIREGEYLPGGRLPPEREMAKRLGVSRPTVREAMIALDIAGIVDIRAGAGIYVTDNDARNAQTLLPALDAGPSPFDLLEARRLLEGAIVGQAAKHATRADLAAIKEALDSMERDVAAGGRGYEADQLFHTRIAAATGNSVLVTLVNGLWASMSAPLFHSLSDRTGLPEQTQMTIEDHRAIFDCLRRHDSDGARTAMDAHLMHVKGILAGARDLASKDGRTSKRKRSGRAS